MGRQIVVRDERWTVLRSQRFEHACLLQLRGIDHANRDELQSLLVPFDRPRVISTARRIRQGGPQRLRAAAAAAVADAVTWPECWSAIHAGIELRAWQLEPAVAAVTGTMRLLLADAVGLGKTIQAGLIIAELFARGLAHRALVLTPPSIRDQWAHELRVRFRLSPVVLDQATLAATATSLPRDVNPWAITPLIVSSIDLVKRPEVRAALDAVDFDVVVVDEAHHLTPHSDRGAVVADLAARTSWIVLVTATPHSGDDHAYRALLAIGDDGGDALRVFRRGRARGDGPCRRSRLVRVMPTAAERALLDATWRYTRALVHARNGTSARLVASVIARRAASSPAAAARTLSRRLALLAGTVAERQPALPWEDEDAAADDVADDVLAARGLADAGHERVWLEQLLRLARVAAQTPSKVAFVRRLLRRTGEPVLIFSEYRDVAIDLAQTLRDLTTVAAIHGGLSPRERRRAVEAFTSGAARTLVATDAAGEGLNLHARCRLVVNVELPWMPRRLEQRIGRVDRIGQTRRVHAVHLAHRGAYEGTVIARLERRRACAAARTGAVQTATEAATPTALRRRMHSIAGCASSGAGAVYLSRLSPQRRRRLHSSVTLLYSTPIFAGSGHLVRRHLTALRLDVGTVRHLTRRLIRDLTINAQVRRALHDDVRQQASSACALLAETGAALVRRQSALMAKIERHAAHQPWQGSLFDRRQEQRAARIASHRQRWCAHLARQRLVAAQLHDLVAGEPQLAAAWLGER